MTSWLESVKPQFYSKFDSVVFAFRTCTHNCCAYCLSKHLPVCVWHSEVELCFYHRLSWGLMYAGFVFILSIFMALIITSIQIVVIVGFMVIFTLFVLYGLSLVNWQNVSLNLFHISDIWVNDVSLRFWYGIVTNLISCFLYVLRKFLTMWEIDYYC